MNQVLLDSLKSYIDIAQTDTTFSSFDMFFGLIYKTVVLVIIGIVVKKYFSSRESIVKIVENIKSLSASVKRVENDSAALKTMLYNHERRLLEAENKPVPKYIKETSSQKLVRVLIVDDQKEVRDFMFDYLHDILPKKEGWNKIIFDIDLAKGYDSGVEFLKDHQGSSSAYDCGIIDYNLQEDKTGFDLWRHCKSEKYSTKSGKFLPLICYSSENIKSLNNVPRDIAPYFLEFKKGMIKKPGVGNWFEFENKLEGIVK